MQVEITKMVWPVEGLFISPTEKVAVGDEIPLFCY